MNNRKQIHVFAAKWCDKFRKRKMNAIAPTECEMTKLDVIERVCIDYCRVTKTDPERFLNDASWDYTERMVIDRTTDSIEHIRNIGNGCKISRKYEVAGKIGSLLDRFDADDFFSYIPGDPDDVIATPDETGEYKITVDFKKRPQKILSGSYDKNGLPEDFPAFAKTVFDFIRVYGFGEILDPFVYGKAKRRKSEYIYCSIVFENGYKSYYYITDDDTIEIGDLVIVPAGKNNHHAVVEVIDIEYFTAEDAPFPVEKTKHIIRKYTGIDFGLPEDDL